MTAVIAALLAASMLAESKPSGSDAPRASPPLSGPKGKGGTPQELVRQGMQLLAGGDVDGAVGRFARAQAERPNSPEIDLDLGLASFRKGEFDRAADRFAAAASKGGGRLEAVAKYNLGNTRVRQGRFEEAASAYRDALRADPGMEDARYNLELVEAHVKRMKELEERRKKAEEEFKKRLEELVKELSALVELQAQTLSRIWKGASEAQFPEPSEEDLKALQELAAQKKPVPDELGTKLARALARARQDAVRSPGSEGSAERPQAGAGPSGDLAGIERGVSSRARKAAETAASLASDLRRAAGAPAQQSGQPAPEHPLAGALERAGGSSEEAARAISRAVEALSGGSPGERESAAEPGAALGLWKLVQALGELASPQGRSGKGEGEELRKALERMAALRARQAALVRDLWASFPDSRGHLPSPDEQRAFWEAVRSGESPGEEERAGLARLEITAGGPGTAGRSAGELAEAERSLAEDSRRVATELEAASAKAGGGDGALGALVAALRGAAEAMEAAAGHLSASNASPPEAERAAVLAFVRLSRAPNQLDELLARLGALLAEETLRLLDTWKSDGSSRGPEPTLEELEAAAKGPEGAELPPELEAKLGRLLAAGADRSSGGKAGRAVAREEAAKLQTELASRAREVSSDARRLAASGARPGEQNPAAALLEQAAGDVDAAASRMDDAASSLARSFAEAEPHQARAVAALMKALSRFASGAAGESGQAGGRPEDQEEGSPEEKESAEDKEKDSREGASGEEDSRPAERKKPARDEPVSKEQAARLLDETSQEERDLRRDLRRLRGSKPVEVLRDW